MPFQQCFQPQFRDSDPDGLIGLRGCLRWFQDTHTWYMHAIDKGNDVIPERYGAAWVYTRYRVRVFHKMDYRGNVDIATWMEPYRQPVLVKQDFIIRQHGRVAAEGKLESCLFSLARQRPLKLSAVEFPEGMPEVIEADIPDFAVVQRTTEGMQPRYERAVRYADLDKNRHMNNLRYIEMFLDACDSAFWADFAPVEAQINFLTQSREGETLTVFSRAEGDALHMAAAHADGKLAAAAVFTRASQ